MKLAVAGGSMLLLAQQSCPPPSGSPHTCASLQAVRGVVEAPRGAGTGRYIVVFDTGQKAVTAATAQSLGVTDAAALTVGGRPALVGRVASPAAVAQQPGVLFVQEETVKRIALVEDEAAPQAVTTLWGLDRIDQRSPELDGDYTPVTTGEGADVCVIDTGVDLVHPALKDRLIEAHSALDGDGADGHGHGTHVAATALSDRYGVAPGAKLLSCRALDQNGSGNDGWVIHCIEWCAARQAERGRPMAINMSLGGPLSPALDLSVCAASAQGIAVVVAGGNAAVSACSGSPARVDAAWTVGATQAPVRRSDGPGWFEARASFSNHGRCLDLFAPGKEIRSARRGDADDDDPAVLSGTSMASPHVAGAAAACLAAGRALPACLIDQATPGALERVGADSPNRYLYVGR